MHGAVTIHVLLGCKRRGGREYLEGRNRILQPRNGAPFLKRLKGKSWRADPLLAWGRPLFDGKKTTMSTIEATGGWVLASPERFLEITSGRSALQLG